ncbi:hypothetical protein Tco_0915789 [Tanacetum coccineum]
MEYCENENDNFMNFETEYQAIAFNDTSDAALSCEPMISPLNNNEIDFKISFDESDDEDYMVIFDKNSFSYEIITVDNLKMDLENENDKVNMPSYPSPEPTIGYIDDLDFFKDFENEFPAIAYNNDLKSKSDPLIEPSIWHLYNLRIRDTHGLDFVGLTEGMRQTLDDRLKMVYTGDEGQELFTSHALRRLFEIRAPLVREFILEFLSTCRMSDTEMGLDVADTLLGSERVIPDKGDLRDYWIAISPDRDFLGPTPSYVFIRDPVRRLCHRMIACSIPGRGQAHEKVTDVDLFYLRSMDKGTANIPYLLAQYLFRHAEGRKSGARLSGVTSLGVLQLILNWLNIYIKVDVFGISLSGRAKEWWDNEIKDTIITWKDLKSKQYSPPIPVPIKYEVNNPDEVCKSEEFKVIRYSIGTDEEFITISPSIYDTWGKPKGPCLASATTSSIKSFADGW